MTKTRFFLLMWFSFLIFPVQQAAAEEAAGCREIARIYDRPLCDSDLNDPLPGAMTSEDLPPELKEEVGQDSLLRKRERLKMFIWKAAVENNIPGAHLQPTEEEIRNYRALFSKAMQDSYAADKKTIQLLTDAYESDRFDPEAKSQIKDLLDTVQMSVYFYEERMKHQKSTPEDFAFVAEKAEIEIASEMLSTWLFDKALFEKYGGRLLYREDSLWPVDAYKAVVNAVKESGSLKIVDPAYDGIFEEIEKGFANVNYEEVPQSDPLYADYFKAPESLFNLGNNEARQETLKAWLASLE